MNEVSIVMALGVALVLSGLIGVERELRLKNAGLRTHALVGLGAAVFTIAGKYGFSANGGIANDGSRVAAQIVSGIGFVGAGLIFVSSDRVRGLTSAAVVWLTAAVGMAAGAGMFVLATGAVACHYIISFAFPHLMRRLPRSTLTPSRVHVTYRDGQGVLRQLLAESTDKGFAILDLEVNHRRDHSDLVEVELEVRGPSAPSALVTHLDELDGVVGVRVGGDND